MKTQVLNHKVTFISIAIFILLSLGTIGFLWYQNQQLKKMVLSYQHKLQPSTTPTATLKPTSDWKIFNNDLYLYQIKYPSSWKQIEHSSSFQDISEFGVLNEPQNNIYIKTYQNNDLFVKSSTETVAEREVLDSDFKHKTENLTIEKYNASRTIIESNPKKVLYTIKNSNKNTFVLIWFSEDNVYIDQILSTFKFLDTKSDIPKPISDLFDSINKNFKTNLKPIEEKQFYSPTGMIDKQSWKIDLLNTPTGGKEFTTFLRTLLSPNDLESAGIGGGGIDAFENNQIKCFHSFMGMGSNINNYLSCALKEMENQKPQTLTQEVPLKSSKLPLIFMAIFIILSLGAVIYLSYQNQQLKKMVLSYQHKLRPSPTPTATPDSIDDWKTYTNTKFGYTFKYPNYFVINDSNPQKISLKDMSKKYAVMSGGTEYINVLGIDFVKSFDSVCFGECRKDKPVEYGENTFIPYVDNGLHEVNNYFIKSNYSIWTTFSYNDPIINQILSTFKFVDDKTAIKSNWKKYTSEKFNYSFEYPSDWFFSPYNEQMSFGGTHSLSSYDMNGIEKYMNHGIIDMQKYGKSIAKLDISVSNFTFPGYFENGSTKKYVKTANEYIDATVYTETVESGNDIDKPTVNYQTNFKINDLDVSEIDFKNLNMQIFDTVKAFYVFPKGRVLRVGVYFKGINEENFETSPLKKEIDEILKSFKFLN